MISHLEREAAAHAEQRLADETIIWLTTVSQSGQPQTSPVGFVWDGSAFLIISAPAAPKVRNLRGNPRAALHLELDTTSESYSVLTVEGEAHVIDAPPGGPAPLSAGERAAYLERHRAAMDSAGMTSEEAFAELSTVIRVTPTRVRSY